MTFLHRSGPLFLVLPGRRLAAFLLLFVALGIAAEARPLRVDDASVPATPPLGDDPLCEDGIIRDDGGAETAYGWVPSVIDGRYVQEYRRDEVHSDTLESFCVCWRRTQPDMDLDFEVHVYAHEFVEEDSDWVPRTEPSAVVPSSVVGVTDQMEGTWVSVDLEGVELPDTPYFSVGVRWDPSVDQFFFVCADTSEGTPIANAWFIDDRADGWASVLDTFDSTFADHRAVMMRLVPGAPVPLPVEVPALGPAALGLLVVALAFFAVRAAGRRRGLDG